MSDDAASWVPAAVDIGRASVARVYDYVLGGGHNFEADRDIAARLLAVQPNVRDIAIRNRSFLQRVVRYLLANGIRQFLDLGSGIPTVGNVHEIAQATAPGTKVVYVDYEEVAVAHSELLLRDNPDAGVVFADVTRTNEVLTAPATRLIDFSLPVGILAVTIGHYISPDADPIGMFARYRNATVPGSYLAISHLTDDFASVNSNEIIETMRQTRDNVFPRGRGEVLAMFDGYELVEPGLVTTSQWRPDPGVTPAVDPEEDGLYAAVGRLI